MPAINPGFVATSDAGHNAMPCKNPCNSMQPNVWERERCREHALENVTEATYMKMRSPRNMILNYKRNRYDITL